MLVQESLAQIGIKTAINKVPGANWRSEMAKKSMPLMVNFFSGWLDYPEYFFFWCYSGQNAIFNTPSYVNPDMDALIDGARAAAADRRQGEIRQGRRRVHRPRPTTKCRGFRCFSLS